MMHFGIGATRVVFAIRPLAFKIARHKHGTRCNRHETKLYAECCPRRKTMLCPVVWCSADGWVLVARYAKPLTESERDHLCETNGFPDWDYDPREKVGHPIEWKPDDWGWLNGKLVAIDYSVNVD